MSNSNEKQVEMGYLKLILSSYLGNLGFILGPFG